MNRTVALLVGGVCVGVLVGCSSVSAAPSASPSPTVTATPTPTPTGPVMEQSDPSLGIVFLDPPALTGVELDVYNWIATYEKEYWRTMTTNQVSPAFAVLASAEIQARMKQIAANNAADSVRIGGTFKARISGIAVTGDAAQGSLCEDYRSATFSDVKGPATPEQAGFGQPSHIALSLKRMAAENRWLIESFTVSGSC